MIENIPAAKTKDPETVKDHIHQFLRNLHESVRSGENFWKEKRNLQLGSMHGKHRLSLKEYSLNDVIFEYNILRQTIFRIIDDEILVDKDSRNLINEMIDEAIRRACVEFEKNTKADEQQMLWQNAIISSAVDHIWIMDLEFKIAYANPELLQNWFKKTDDIMGKSIQCLNYPTALEKKITTESEKVLKGSPSRFEITCLNALEDERTYDYIIFPVRNTSNEVLAIGGIARDITIFKELEENLSNAKDELQKAVMARDEFISIASHELKTPLTSLKLLVQIEERKLERADTLSLRI